MKNLVQKDIEGQEIISRIDLQDQINEIQENFFNEKLEETDSFSSDEQFELIGNSDEKSTFITSKLTHVELNSRGSVGISPDCENPEDPDHQEIIDKNIDNIEVLKMKVDEIVSKNGSQFSQPAFNKTRSFDKTMKRRSLDLSAQNHENNFLHSEVFPCLKSQLVLTHCITKNYQKLLDQIKTMQKMDSEKDEEIKGLQAEIEKLFSKISSLEKEKSEIQKKYKIFFNFLDWRNIILIMEMMRRQNIPGKVSLRKR